jgi:hypothetical protein
MDQTDVGDRKCSILNGEHRDDAVLSYYKDKYNSIYLQKLCSLCRETMGYTPVEPGQKLFKMPKYGKNKKAKDDA